MNKYVPEYLLGETLGLYSDPHHSLEEQCEPDSFRPVIWTEMYMTSYIYGLISNSLIPEAPGPD